MEVSGLLHVPAALSPKNESHLRVYLLKGPVGPKVIMHLLEKRKISCAYLDLNPGSSYR